MIATRHVSPSLPFQARALAPLGRIRVGTLLRQPTVPSGMAGRERTAGSLLA